MVDTTANDILMYFVFKGGDPVTAESTAVIEDKSDDVTSDFQAGKFFEVEDFTFVIRLKDSESKTSLTSSNDERSYARWRSLTDKQLKPDPVYKADIEDFSVTRMLDASSPILLQHCLNAQRFDKAVLVKRARSPNGPILGILRMEFSDVMIKSIDWSDGTAVKETCKFRYAKLSVKYVKRTLEDGREQTSKGVKIECNWQSTPKNG